MRVIFSPHIDDSFLSLGGLILNWRKKKERVQVIDVFSISNYTKSGLGERKEVTRQRKQEERNVQKFTDVHTTFLDFLDAPLRGYKMRRGEFIHPNRISRKIDQSTLEAIERKTVSFFAHFFTYFISNFFPEILKIDSTSSSCLVDSPIVYH